MDKSVTGIMVYYYAVCRKKLWYFYHEINMEQDSENVKIGKLLDDSSYLRDDKHINIDNVINIDFIRSQGILHEIKKSKKIEEASILQVKYYLYYLKKRGVNGIRGKIDYPLLKQSIDVCLSDDDIEQIDKIVTEINEIISMKIPPISINNKICKSCAYYDLCYI
ncbi:CRISPR-associated protein Cas4 [Sedimentibacter saalensis]|uniref:CRISPR-associated exonuclease Cas4 n=1 Tax=Sedimentibacter saalensis TaxID=130788 RepID=A0A562JDZ1_9FIRM|nr:CRISPR-associated protein Cas4 [Sedimentibacter saalensis]TWH81350.1 CRISPR-associated exonuclease, Cas4 family [Sedimentibacter saalensis]